MIGRRCLKRPDCSVEVVEATVMNRCASAPGAQRERERAGRRPARSVSRLQFHGSSPLMKAAASAVAGCAKKRSTGARSTSRPPLMNRISSPRRRAWPRLCVVITILVPLAANLADDRLDLARRAGIEIRRGLVEEQHFGPERPRARERELLLLAAGEHARAGWCATCARAPPLRARRARAARARARGTPASLSPYVDVGERRAAQHDRPLEHHRLRARPRSSRLPRQTTRPDVGASSP